MAAGEPWTQEEEVIACSATWGCLPEVARTLGRSVGAVAARRCKLGAGPPKRAWPAEDDAALDRLLADGASVEEAVAVLGRSMPAAYARRHVRRAAGEDLLDERCR